MNSLKANCSVMELEGRQLNGLTHSFATVNKELWLIVLNQTGLLLYLVSLRAPILPPCCSLCIFINDITSEIELEIRHFADDCVCYCEIKNVEDIVKFQKDNDRLGSWPGPEMWFEIPTRQVQHDAADEQTD